MAAIPAPFEAEARDGGAQEGMPLAESLDV